VSIGGAANGLDQGARKLQGAMLEHANLTIERMPGLGYALNRFIAEAPLRLSSLIARPPPARSRRFGRRRNLRRSKTAPA
jgi:hypothetical protein